MDLVSFVTLECGTDLIVSFAVSNLEDASSIESLTILRTPEYESLLEDRHRGATVTFERDGSEENDDYLRGIVYQSQDCIIELQTDLKRYVLDIRKIDKGDIQQMIRVFRLMNFDSTISIDGF